MFLDYLYRQLAATLSYMFHKDEYHYSAIRASGAVSGIYSNIKVLPEMMIYGIIPGYIWIGYLIRPCSTALNKVGNITTLIFWWRCRGLSLTTQFMILFIYDETDSLIVIALLNTYHCLIYTDAFRKI
jgi:hypothetical protein